MEDTAKIITTPEYLKVLDDEKKITFATIVNGYESHHQISILDFDTSEKIETKMAETLVQIKEELSNSNNDKRNAPIPKDIQALVDAAVIKEAAEEAVV